MIKRNNQIQALRGIFCMCIMFYHYTSRYSQIYQKEKFAFKIGEIAVVIGLGGFLFITGYYLINPNKFKNMRTFLLQKIERLYPEYLLSIIIIFLVGKLGFLGANRSVNTLEFFLNIPMLNVFLGVKYVDGAHWYLTFLVLMIIWGGILQKLKLYKYVLFWELNFLGIFFVALGSKIDIKFLNLIEDYVRYYLIISLGTYFFCVNNNLNNKVSKKVLLFFFLSIYFLDGIKNSILVMISIFIILLSLKEKLKILDNIKIIIYIGNISYLVYLLHQNIGYSIINFFEHYMRSNVLFEVCLVITIIIIMVTLLEKVKELYLKKKV